MRELIQALEQSRIDLIRRNQQIDELCTSLAQLTLLIRSSPSPNPPRLENKPSSSPTMIRALVRTGPASSLQPTPSPLRIPTEPPPSRPQVTYFYDSSDEYPPPSPPRKPTEPKPEIFPICGDCLESLTGQQEQDEEDTDNLGDLEEGTEANGYESELYQEYIDDLEDLGGTEADGYESDPYRAGYGS
jgi:hypothetical protein